MAEAMPSRESCGSESKPESWRHGSTITANVNGRGRGRPRHTWLVTVGGHLVCLGGARLPGIGPVVLATESWGQPPSAVQQCKPPGVPPLLLG
jgi:hypothetical protein